MHIEHNKQEKIKLSKASLTNAKTKSEYKKNSAIQNVKD